MGDAELGNALIEFWARNVRSYRDEVVLSMEATRLANNGRSPERAYRGGSTRASAPGGGRVRRERVGKVDDSERNGGHENPGLEVVPRWWTWDRDNACAVPA